MRTETIMTKPSVYSKRPHKYSHQKEDMPVPAQTPPEIPSSREHPLLPQPSATSLLPDLRLLPQLLFFYTHAPLCLLPMQLLEASASSCLNLWYPVNNTEKYFFKKSSSFHPHKGDELQYADFPACCRNASKGQSTALCLNFERA